MRTITLTIPGKPFGKEEDRSNIIVPPEGQKTKEGKQKKPYAVHYTPTKTRNYMKLIGSLYRLKCPDVYLRGALKLTISAFYPIAKSVSQLKRTKMLDNEIMATVRPDTANIQKVIEDALNEVAYDDDKQIVSNVTNKYYSENPRIVITIEELSPIDIV